MEVFNVITDSQKTFRSYIWKGSEMFGILERRVEVSRYGSCGHWTVKTTSVL